MMNNRLILGIAGLLTILFNLLGGLALFLGTFIWGIILSDFSVSRIKNIKPFAYGQFLRYLTAAFVASALMLLISDRIYKWLPASRQGGGIPLNGKHIFIKAVVGSGLSGLVLGLILAFMNSKV